MVMKCGKWGKEWRGAGGRAQSIQELHWDAWDWERSTQGTLCWGWNQLPSNVSPWQLLCTHSSSIIPQLVQWQVWLALISFLSPPKSASMGAAGSEQGPASRQSRAAGKASSSPHELIIWSSFDRHENSTGLDLIKSWKGWKSHLISRRTQVVSCTGSCSSGLNPAYELGHPSPQPSASIHVGLSHQQTSWLTTLYSQLKTRDLLHPKLVRPTAKAFVTLPPSETGKLKQYASFMHLEKQRKSELKTDWCLCLHVSAWNIQHQLWVLLRVRARERCISLLRNQKPWQLTKK